MVFTKSLEPLRCIQSRWTQESESQFYSMTITFPPLSPRPIRGQDSGH